MLGHILAYLHRNRFHAILAHHFADLHGNLPHLFFGHHSHRLHRHFVFNALDNFANGLHRHLPHLFFSHHSHRLHWHLLHDLLVYIPHCLHRNLSRDHSIHNGCFRNLHGDNIGLVDTSDLLRDNARRDGPHIATALPHHQAGSGIDSPAAGHESELGGAWRNQRSDLIDIASLVGVGCAQSGDRFRHCVGFIPFGSFINRTTHNARLLLDGRLVDRLHHGKAFFTSVCLNDIASDVVAHVTHLRLVDRLHDGGAFFAGACLPNGTLHGVATLRGLCFPNGLCDGIHPRVVNRFVGDAVGSDLLFVVNGLKIKAVGLRGRRGRDRDRLPATRLPVLSQRNADPGGR